MTAIVEGECDPVSFIIQMFFVILGILTVLKIWQIWPTLALKVTEICIGGACP